jgi:exodeoxyribonuclease VII large subunit
LDSIEIYLHQSLNRRLDQWQSRLSLLTIRLTDPEPLLANYQSDLRHFAQSLSAQLNQLLNQKAHLLQEARLTLQQQHPENRLLRVESHYQTLKQRLQRATQILLKDKQQLLATTAQQLHLVSPLATLERGYSITLKDLTLVRSTDQLRIGDTLTTRLSNGEVISEVIQIES